MPETLIDRDSFLANLRQSGLVSAEQLSAAARLLPNTHRGRLVARALVEKGFLTKFQAELLLAGRTDGFFLGQYRILDQLGRGGMGRVFKAVHQALGRVVALKMISPELVRTEAGRQMFEREVETAARLHHPHIVAAYDANREGDRFYLVMEFVDGPNLEQWVRERGPLPAAQACDFVRQVALGLDYASGLGMVHRDIKPANLLVQRPAANAVGPGMVKLLDFGLARFHSPDPDTPKPKTVLREGAVAGTPDFMSPEQARNLHEVDIRSDLYSLGCTFYFLLTGRPPFPGGTVMEKIIRHASEEPWAVDQHRPDLPPEISHLVRRLMAKQPEDRFQTPAELVRALEPFTACPTTWAVAGPTPPPDDSPTLIEARLEPDSLGEDKAGPVGQLPADLWPSGDELELAYRQVRQSIRADQVRRLRQALLVAVGVVVGALLVTILFALGKK